MLLETYGRGQTQERRSKSPAEQAAIDSLVEFFVKESKNDDNKTLRQYFDEAGKRVDEERQRLEALFKIGKPTEAAEKKPQTLKESFLAKTKRFERFKKVFKRDYTLAKTEEVKKEELANYKFAVESDIIFDIITQIVEEGFSTISGGLIGNLIENIYGRLSDTNEIRNQNFQKELVSNVLARLSKEPGQFYFKLANSPASKSYVSAKTNSFGDLILATNLGEIQIEDATVLPNLQIYRGPLPGAEVQKSTEQLKNQPNLLETLESAKLNQINRALASIAKKLEISGSTQLNWLYNEILENLETVLTKNGFYLNDKNSHEIEPFAREILKEVLEKFGENPNYKISYFNLKNSS